LEPRRRVRYLYSPSSPNKNDMAKVRTLFKNEIDALLPALHETYRQVGIFQKERSERNAQSLLEQLNLIGEKLYFFKEWLQPKKQAYFDALLDPDLSLSDRIIALDTAVGMMHIEFAVERAYKHRETEALRRVLEQSRHADVDIVSKAETPDDDILVKGIPASPGRITGKAMLVRKNADYRRLPDGCIIVARMTRPEIIAGLDRILGIVTDIGGSLCHAAIVAREKGIPCVVGTKKATELIRNKMLIAVDGTTGEVKKIR